MIYLVGQNYCQGCCNGKLINAFWRVRIVSLIALRYNVYILYTTILTVVLWYMWWLLLNSSLAFEILDVKMSLMQKTWESFHTSVYCRNRNNSLRIFLESLLPVIHHTFPKDKRCLAHSTHLVPPFNTEKRAAFRLGVKESGWSETEAISLSPSCILDLPPFALRTFYIQLQSYI